MRARTRFPVPKYELASQFSSGLSLVNAFFSPLVTAFAQVEMLPNMTPFASSWSFGMAYVPDSSSRTSS